MWELVIQRMYPLGNSSNTFSIKADIPAFPVTNGFITLSSYEAEAIDLGADFYDHIHDHRHGWSTWRQDATRARKVIFAVAERSEKR